MTQFHKQSERHLQSGEAMHVLGQSRSLSNILVRQRLKAEVNLIAIVSKTEISLPLYLHPR